MAEKNKILIINTGSSSIKFQLFNMIINDHKQPEFSIRCKGLVERIAIKNSKFIIEIANGSDFIKYQVTKDIADHAIGAQTVIDALLKYKVIDNFDDIKRIGHRIVHGGQKFTNSIVIDDSVIAGIKACISLAPLHNPPALKGLSSFQKLVPHAKHVAVFDTSFHATIPEEKYLYSVPYDWYKTYQVRRYGFHGTSYRYVLDKLSSILNKPKTEINAIICHLGNGASICAIKNGKSFNTSMGLTPLDGLIMGSRSGIIDPSIHGYMCKVKPQATIETITDDLNKNSGLLGISGHSSDLRDVLATINDKNDKYYHQSVWAIQMFVQRIGNYIVQYANDLANCIDAIVFTAGIGENAAVIRQLVIDQIKVLNLQLSVKKNNDNYCDYLEISDKQSAVAIFKIRTNEELMICQDTYHLLKNL